ncbi:MAG: hypothetical protein ACM37W_03810 [Actinomycetota bacterium]
MTFLWILVILASVAAIGYPATGSAEARVHFGQWAEIIKAPFLLNHHVSTDKSSPKRLDLGSYQLTERHQ